MSTARIGEPDRGPRGSYCAHGPLRAQVLARLRAGERRRSVMAHTGACRSYVDQIARTSGIRPAREVVSRRVREMPAKGCVCRGCHYWHGGDCDSDLAARLKGATLLSTGPDETCPAWRAGA